MVVLKSDGTVISTGENDIDPLDITDWTDIIEVAVGANHNVGLKTNGSILTFEDKNDSSLELEKLKALNDIKTNK